MLHNEQTGSIKTSVQSYCGAFVIVGTRYDLCISSLNLMCSDRGPLIGGLFDTFKQQCSSSLFTLLLKMTDCHYECCLHCLYCLL